MNDRNTKDERSVSRDALAELIQAAGPRAEPPADHHRSVRASARHAWQAKVRERRRRRYLAVAASVAALIGVAALLTEVMTPEPLPVASVVRSSGGVTVRPSGADAWMPYAEGASLNAGDRLRVDGAGAALRLAGVGSLRVRAGTELVLDSAHRLALVDGTVYVDTGESSIGDTIEVATAFGVVRDVGTQFEVRSSAGSLRVRVRSGRVELADSRLGEAIDAAAGSELELDAVGGLERRPLAPDAPGWDWAAALAPPMPGRETVLGYLDWIARETGKSLQFAETRTELRVELIRWRGDPRGLTPLELLEAVAVTSDLSYELTPNGAIVIRER